MSHDYAVTDGHALLSLHRYLEDVRHMVIFDDLVEYGHHRVRLSQGHGAGQAGTFEKYDGLKGAAYGKQTSQRYRRHDLPPAQAGHPALDGEENRQDHLPCVGAFQ